MLREHAIMLLTYFYACSMHLGRASDLVPSDDVRLDPSVALYVLYVILVYFLTSFLIVVARQSRSTSHHPGRSRKEPSCVLVHTLLSFFLV